MAITRKTIHTIAAVEINDDYGITLTVHNQRETIRLDLTPGEAVNLGTELVTAGTVAAVQREEDEAS